MEIRPRWSKDLPVEKAIIMAEFSQQLDTAEGVMASVWEHHIILKIPTQEQHFWSPQMTVSFEDLENGLTRVRGLCGPRSSVWMMFIFFYFLLGFTAMVVMIMGFSQMSLGLSHGILWLIPVIAFLILMVFLTAKMGQSLARDEMERLFSFCRNIIVPIEEGASRG
ncbi:MAG TPA: hypothetical protein VJ953_17155 [Saprospiraceae bacterium]|nr:hypothetical protein [Saprospiraceae bacterium]